MNDKKQTRDTKKQTRDTKQSDYDYLMSVIEPFLRGAQNGKDKHTEHTD